MEVDSDSGAASSGAAGAGGGGGGPAWPCGEPAVLAKYIHGSAVAVDADHVYWPAYEGMTRFDKASGESVVVAPLSGGVLSIALDSGRLYWTEDSVRGEEWTQILQYGSLRTVDAAGGESTLLADGFLAPDSIVVDTESVFWIDHGSYPFEIAPDGAVFAVSKGGGEPAVLAEGQWAPMAARVDDSGVYVTTSAPPEPPDTGSGRITKWSKDGADMKVLVTGGLPGSLALDGADLYWSGHAYGGTLNVVPVNGGTSVSLTGEPTTEWDAVEIAVDSEDIYWLDADSGVVRAMPKSGGDIRVIASGQDQPFGLAVDDTCVYWVNTGSHVLMAAAKR